MPPDGRGILHGYLIGMQLSSPSTANLQSLRSGRVDFVPYQYRPVPRLIRGDHPRLLVADEVGVGKRVEAGLVIKELPARSDLSSALAIRPRALMTERNWVSEIKRSDEHFEALDGKTLRHCLRETYLDGHWPDRYSQVIIMFSLFESDLLLGQTGRGSLNTPGLLSNDPPPPVRPRDRRLSAPCQQPGHLSPSSGSLFLRQR